MAAKGKGAAAPGYNWGRSKLITKAGVLAKRANQRLRELENKHIEGSSNAYRFVETSVEKGKFWATKGTQKKSAGKIKFNTNFRSMSDEDIQKELKIINQFLNAPTSSTKGTRSKIDKLTDKFNARTGLSFSPSEFVETMTDDLVKEMFKQFSASAIMDLFLEDPDYSANAEQILQGLVTEKQKSLAELDFLTVQNAFENWQQPLQNDDNGLSAEEMDELASIGIKKV